MHITKEENYGADADGNRGITVYHATLEPSDKHWIMEQIQEKFDADIEIYTVFNYDPISDVEIKFEVNINDWKDLNEKDI